MAGVGVCAGAGGTAGEGVSVGEAVGVPVGVGVGEGELFFLALEGVGTVFLADGILFSTREAEIGAEDRSTGLNRSGGRSMGIAKACVYPGGTKEKTYRMKIIP